MTSPPEKPAHDEQPELIARQSRVALALFFVYLAAYAGFMGLSAFAHDWMARPVLAGVNLAIIYGLGLILGAVVLAIIYMIACKVVLGRYREEQRRP
jgi:uncharacterized membrane protein (DUF485 family)